MVAAAELHTRPIIMRQKRGSIQVIKTYFIFLPVVSPRCIQMKVFASVHAPTSPFPRRPRPCLCVTSHINPSKSSYFLIFYPSAGSGTHPHIYTLSPPAPSTLIHMKWFWNNISGDSRGNNKSTKAKKKNFFPGKRRKEKKNNKSIRQRWLVPLHLRLLDTWSSLNTA